MTDKAAIAAQVVDIQNDRLHKGFIKVTVHVGAEFGPLLTGALGWPTYTDPVPVALARLDPDGVRAAAQRKLPPPNNRLAVRAGILCHEPKFHAFLNQEYWRHLPKGCAVNDEEGAATMVRFLCDVRSRADIKPDTPAAEKFDGILNRFAGWEADLEG